MPRGSSILLLVVACLCVAPPEARGWPPAIDAPPSLAGTAERIRRIDRLALGIALARAGLDLPTDIRVTLIDEDDARARTTPSWIVGLAMAPDHIVIFPRRITSYPYDSIESVMRHEVAHLALDLAAGGRALPRWFHEGVAISVDAGWRFSDGARLFVEVSRGPVVDDVEALFSSAIHHETAGAYLLSAALVADLRAHHGPTLPGDLARIVAAGVPFDRAFEMATGETPDEAAARAWAAYLRWTTWIPAATSASTLWMVILAVATLAYVARRRRRARLRTQWDEEDRWLEGDDPDEDTREHAPPPS